MNGLTNGDHKRVPAKQPDADVIASRIARASVFSSKVDPGWRLNNFANDTILDISAKLRIKGFTSIHGVQNYLNVPFGHIPGRFLPAKMVELDRLTGTLDATLYGPRCPQIAAPSRWDVEHDWEKLGCDQRMSEFDCLSANIYVPPAGTPGGPFPVIAHIHGGALTIGDAGPEKDANHLIKRAVALGKPFVFVSLAYRVNHFGFLTSSELLQEQKELGYDAVYMQGFHDQRIGLRWIQRYVGLFGGDSSQVTLAGESAGAVSIWVQLKYKEERLFKRCFIRSFPPPKVGTIDECQKRFDALIEALGIPKDAPGYVKVAALRSVSAENLLKLIPMPHPEVVYDPGCMVAPVGGEGPDSLAYWTSVPNWVTEVVIGCTRDETSLFGCNSWPLYSWKDAEDSFRRCYPPGIAEKVLASNAFLHARSPYEAMYAVSSEAAFAGPSIEAAEMMAKTSRAKVAFYIVEGTEEHPGPLQGCAPHGADLTYYTYQPGHRKYPEMAATSDHFSACLASFVAGEGGWEDLAKAGRYMAFDGSKTCLKHLHRDRQDREILWKDGQQRKRFYQGGLGILAVMFSKGNLNAI